jgi:hypothetical protein
MTLVVSAHSRDTLWMLTDRRLYSPGRKPVDNGVKVMVLETVDGIALLGYAGLGATARRTQPSQWMSGVLRGRNLPMEESLGRLAYVATQELPPHIRQLEVKAHFIVAPAYLRDVGWRMFAIDNVIERGSHRYRFATLRRGNIPTAPCPQFAFAGSGGLHVEKTFDDWKDELDALMDAHDQGRVPDLVVADWFAKLNETASRQLESRGDTTVSSRSLVVWRRRPGFSGPSGGAHQYYEGLHREASNPGVPTIGMGMPLSEMSKVSMKHLAGRPVSEWSDNVLDAMYAEIEALSDTPDDKLR